VLRYDVTFDFIMTQQRHHNQKSIFRSKTCKQFSRCESKNC